MEEKYYKVFADNFLWKKGAILKLQRFGPVMGYAPIDKDHNTTEFNGNEFISQNIVENNPLYFLEVVKKEELTFKYEFVPKYYVDKEGKEDSKCDDCGLKALCDKIKKNLREIRDEE